jgi:hypothetical protein
MPSVMMTVVSLKSKLETGRLTRLTAINSTPESDLPELAPSNDLEENPIGGRNRPLANVEGGRRASSDWGRER